MKNIQKELNNYRRILFAVNKELLKLPAGSLIIRGTRYYHATNGEEIGITKNKELIKLLSRKKTLLAFKKRLEQNISVITKSQSKLVSTSYKEIISTLPATFQKLPNSYFFHPSMKKWLAKMDNENTYKGRRYETQRGILLRSKSEYMIACLLEEYGILYLYEPAINLEGKTKYPDFIILNPFTGKIIIWEHFGALHMPNYEQEMNQKMELYLANGFIPFETIIYTFEFDMNTRRLRSLIENIILD